MEHELVGKIMTEFAVLRLKTSSYLINDTVEKAKGTKSVLKRKLKVEEYKHCLDATQLENETNYLEKN